MLLHGIHIPSGNRSGEGSGDADFLDIVERRVPLLKERADIIITLKDGTIDESLAAVTARLKEYGYAW